MSDSFYKLCNIRGDKSGKVILIIESLVNLPILIYTWKKVLQHQIEIQIKKKTFFIFCDIIC